MLKIKYDFRDINAGFGIHLRTNIYNWEVISLFCLVHKPFKDLFFCIYNFLKNYL